MKKLFGTAVVFILCFILCSCDNVALKGSSWEYTDEVFKTTLEFTPSGVFKEVSVVINEENTDALGVTEEMLENSSKERYFNDLSSKKNNRYLKIYHTEEDMEQDINYEFMPYYIKDGKLYLNGNVYSPAEKEGK